MKKETRNLIVENIGLAWVYSSPKARQYLNEALKGFAQHQREQDENLDALAAYVMEEADQPATVKGRVLKALTSRNHGINLKTIAGEADTSLAGVRSYIKDLRNEGHGIKTIRNGSRWPLYRYMKRGA